MSITIDEEIMITISDIDHFYSLIALIGDALMIVVI